MAVGRLIVAGSADVVITVTTPTTAGDIKVIGEALLGRCNETVVSGSSCAYMVPTADVYQLPKVASTSVVGVIGDYAYFASGTTNVTTVATANGNPIGVFHKAGATADTTAQVRMSAGGYT
jgi:hypothetical protein